MKIRKYTAGNAQEAIAKVKSDLGTEALIISTKKVRQKGLLGLFRKPMTEVMAAIDEQAQAKAKRLASQVRGEAAAPGDVFAQFQSQLREANRAATAAPNLGALTSQVQAYQAQTQPAQLSAQAQTPQTPQTLQTPQTQRAQEHTSEPARGRQDQAQAGLARPAGGRAQQEAAPPPDRLSELESKVTQMEGLLTKVYQEVSSTSKLVAEDENAEKLAPLTKVLQLFYNNLIKNEVEPEFSMNIIERVSDSLKSEANANDATTLLYNEVATALGKPETISIREGKKPTVALFVGPTGVGKTTTLAKIAANYAINQNLRVGMITADTYRIAAVQQLKTYAEILGIPVAVVYAPGELKKAIEGFADKDLVLIDTAGRSHRSRAQFDELRALVTEAGADEVFLVLSSTTSIRNNREIINNYGFLNEFKLIFTKADETQTLGAVLNARLMTGKKLSYVTIGQSVPDDIEVASVDKIARNLIGSVAE